MTTFSIAVSAGVAAVYPNGQQADAVVMRETDAPLSFVHGTPAVKTPAPTPAPTPSPAPTVAAHPKVDPKDPPKAEPKAEPVPAPAPAKVNVKQIKMTEDKEAPAAGVATTEPLGKRTGTIRVQVQEGEVMVRLYHLDTKFTEEKVVAGQKLDREVTEENKITLAVYV